MFVAVALVGGGSAAARYAADAKATKAELAQEIIGARASFGDLGYFKSQPDPESQRIAKMIESRQAQVEQIIKEYEAGSKSPKQTLTELQAVFAPPKTAN